MDESVNECGKKDHENEKIDVVGIETVRHLSHEKINGKKGKGGEAEINAAEAVFQESYEEGETASLPPSFPEAEIDNDDDEEVSLERVGKIGGEHRDLYQQRTIDNHDDFKKLNHD
jgi:hypothetical protein